MTNLNFMIVIDKIEFKVYNNHKIFPCFLLYFGIKHQCMLQSASGRLQHACVEVSVQPLLCIIMETGVNRA